MAGTTGPSPQGRGGGPHRHAFVDESIRPGAPYLICAAILTPADLSAIRSTMLGLRVRGARRVHMEKDGRNRSRVVAAVAELPIQARIYLADVTRTSQRRARSKCLHHMVPNLLDAGVSNLYLESCDQDRDDRIVLAAARDRVGARAQLHFDHRRPHEEPMLWVPDVIAWAWGKDARWRARIDHLVTDVLDTAA